MPSARDEDSLSSSASPVDALSLDKLSLKDDKVDRLSQLPPEILREIFRLAYEGGRGPSHPLSRSLAVFHYELALEDIKLRGYKSLKLFVRTILARPELGAHVRSFAIHLPPEEEDDTDESGRRLWSVAEDEVLPKFFGRLGELSSLIIEGARPLADLVLRPSFASHSLQKLEALRIDMYHIPGVERSLHPERYLALAEYPRLDKLFLFVGQPAASSPAPSPISPLSCQHFSRLTTLDLSSSRLDPVYAAAILGHCTNVGSLYLSDESGQADIPSLLETLPNPQGLKALDVRSFSADRYSGAGLHNLLSALRSTTALTSLTISDSFLVAPSLFDFLKTLPLRHLEFGLDTRISPEHLLPFLRPSAYPPTLESLVLDNLFAFRGQRTNPDDFADVFFGDDGEPEVPPGWEPPDWEDGWTPEAAEAVKAAAEAVGVAATGSSLDAADIEMDYQEEVDKVENYRATMQAREREIECRRRHGDEDDEDDGSEPDDDF
ncbi:hypothetical protein JCM6882_005075 [Rhodosporidiobolus microsporus]